jgi:hypothetical protein
MADPIIPPEDSPFASMTPKQALAQINIAIAHAEVSQSYKIGDRELQRGDLRWMIPNARGLRSGRQRRRAAASACAGSCPYEPQGNEAWRRYDLLERAINVVAPRRAAAMAQSRFLVNFAGQYAGARYDKTSLRNFRPMAGSADADAIGDLPTLRARSRDLARNTPIARGARNTTKHERDRPRPQAALQGGPLAARP